MKIIALVFLCATVYLNNAAPTTPAPVDYREKYDHLLMEVINQRIRDGERFLERLSHQLKDYETSKKADVKEHIQRELDFALPMVKGIEHHFETELKKKDLDMLERFTIEKAKDEGLLVIKALGEIQKAIGAPKTSYYADEKPIDYRSEYDRLLFQTIEERIRRADGMLLGLNRQLAEFQKTKSAEVKAQIIREVDGILPFLKMSEDHAVHELKRTDLNHIERFLYEKSQDQVKLLIKHYTQIESAVKGKAVVFEYFAASTVAPTDFRSEYDRLLFETTEMNIRRADQLLVTLQRQVNEYKQTKNKDIITRVAGEVDFTLPLIKRAQEHAKDELKKTDLNHVERYLFEKINDEANILIKHYTQLEKEVKSGSFFIAEYYAEVTSADIRTVESKFLEISHSVREYFVHKTDEEKTRLVTEIDTELVKVRAMIKDLETKFETTHGILERFHVEREILLLRGVLNGYTREESRIKASTF